MALTNQDRVTRTMSLLKDGLSPFVERELEAKHGKYWISSVTTHWHHDLNWQDDDTPHLDISPLLRIMWEQWNDVFRNTLGHAERSLVSELKEYRNKWAHQEAFSSDDVYRVMDSAERLLTAVAASEAAELGPMKMELLRVKFDKQASDQKRKAASIPIDTAPVAGLMPWRQVVDPHQDVASGKYQQAEFAADLWQVHRGEGSTEYRDPVEFFRRTYLTESLRRMLLGSMRRVTGGGGDPVIQLQTNFGGGKTHSMLALYHLFSGVLPTELPGLEEVLAEAEVTKLPSVRRAVLVGNKISPGNPSVKPDGTVVRTLWGEMAWQLGGPAGYALVQADDEKATNPGDTLRQLFTEYGPCLILIDEWVAYARQLHDDNDLPGGNFDTQFTFAQALTESAKLANNCVLVISLPASDTSGASPKVDDVEVGGHRGRQALERLRNVVGRIDSAWRPASAEEGFEIVRRRLFKPLTDQKQFQQRDVVAKAFAEMYRTQHQEFPPECRESDYEKRMKAAYPIHPEIFDRLYTDWSTLVKFQRTRGVLRLMAAVIHSLWEKGDQNPLIMPAHITIDDPRVQHEMTRNLSDNWVPVIEKDVDGPNSLPLRLDGEIPSLGKYHACRRVARTIYLGSAPLSKAAHRGLEDRRIRLGCMVPGESAGVFGDALRRMASSATYLYSNEARYWYSTQPTVTKLAGELAEQYQNEQDKVASEIERRLRDNLSRRGDFAKVHLCPQASQDVSDEMDLRLVVLRSEHPYFKGDESAGLSAAKSIIESRGNAPRTYRNSLVFLAADSTRMMDLTEAVCRYLAWATIENEWETRNLDPQQRKQAQTQKDSADSSVEARLPEVYQWLLYPAQDDPTQALTWEASKLTTGSPSLAVRAAQKLLKDEILLTSYGGELLRMDMDKIPLWRGEHVALQQLAEDFASYNYLPKLQDPQQLILEAVKSGVREMLWFQNTFAYARAYDDSGKRYQGVVAGDQGDVNSVGMNGLVVKPEIAEAQVAADKKTAEACGISVPATTGGSAGDGITLPVGDGESVGVIVEQLPRRFHGSVTLDPLSVGPQAGKIAAEVISHLAALEGAEVTITLDIQAKLRDGADTQVVRTVTENAQHLKFDSHGFERE